MESRFEFYIPSSDPGFRFHGIQWVPDGPVSAVLQISHGMMEHIKRYDRFARAMGERGIAVIGHDHLGHGKTADEASRGCFSETDGAAHVLEDLALITAYGKRQYPGLPFFFLGHSMGSFFGRRYLSECREKLNGALFIGTGGQPTLLLRIAMLAARRSEQEHGRLYHDAKLNHLLFGRLNRPFEPGRTSHDWLTRDDGEIETFEADPLCQFDFSVGACCDFVQVMWELDQQIGFEKVPRSLPVIFLSGDRDSVGEMGKGVKRVCERYRKAGFSDVSMKLYPGARHELLHELNREAVYEDVAAWISAHQTM